MTTRDDFKHPMIVKRYGPDHFALIFSNEDPVTKQHSVMISEIRAYPSMSEVDLFTSEKHLPMSLEWTVNRYHDEFAIHVGLYDD